MLCNFVDCFTEVSRRSACERRVDNTVMLFQSTLHPPAISDATLDTFFPAIDIVRFTITRAVNAADLLRVMDDTIAAKNVRKFILNLSSDVIEQYFVPIANRYRKATFIALSSISQKLRTSGLRPRNLYFSLQSESLFVPQTFNLRADSSGDDYIIIDASGGDAYQEYVKAVAESFGITAITPAQVPDFQAGLLQAQVIYISLYFPGQQQLAVSALPEAFSGSVVFIAMPPVDQQIADALPPNAFNILLYSPGTGTIVHEDSAWSLATRPTFLTSPVTSIMSAFYYLSFLEDWDTFLTRNIVLDTNDANYRLLINPIRVSAPSTR